MSLNVEGSVLFVLLWTVSFCSAWVMFVICIFMYTPPVCVYVWCEQERGWVGHWLVPGMFHDAPLSQ